MVTDDHLNSKSRRLPLHFFTRTDVVQIARELIGKVLVTEFDGQRTAGIITETEAYRAPDDRACHAFGNRRTARTAVMFQEGGRAYIYLCYGIHHLMNVVTAPEGVAHAVLIRAIEPIEGQDIMLERRQVLGGTSLLNRNQTIKPALSTGPGALSQALGLNIAYTGQSLLAADSPVWIEAREPVIQEQDIDAGKRIGVDYAGECAEWPWRFWLKSSRFRK
jgi:DNA-3-methyladenine glycosylase